MSNPIIITGATGFIGHHLVPVLLSHGYDIHIITRNKHNAEPFDWYNDVHIIEHDLAADSIDFDIPQNASLIHLAWQGLPNYKDDFHFTENLPHSYRFIKHLVNHGVQNVLVTGTCFEYGMQCGALAPNTKTDPQNAYALAKDTLRKYLINLQNDAAFKLQWARLFYMYGPGQNPKSLLALLDTAIDNGDPVFNMSGGEQLRDYLHVSDVAKQICDVLTDGQNGAFNICHGTPISIRQLVENHIAKRGASIELNLGHYPYPDYEPMAFWGDKGTQ